MTINSRFTRRRMIQLTGGAAAVGLAGCVGASTDSAPSGGVDQPTEDQHDDVGAGETGDGHDDGEEAHDDGEEGHDEAIGAPADTADVKMVSTESGFHFEPHVVRVNAGGTVTFINESGSHSTTAYHPEFDQPQLVPDGTDAWDSGLLMEAGATFEHTFETEGVYHYYCIPHESMGMIGSVIVGEPDPHDAMALEEPPVDKPERVREKLEELNGMIRPALGDEH